MSLILLWENPTDLFSNPQRRAQVSRTVGLMRSLVDRDSPLGICEDQENDDPTASYEVTYLNANDSPGVTVLNADIRKQRLTSSLCRITFNFVHPDGTPDTGRTIVASDEVGGSGLYHRTVATNLAGAAFMVFRPGVRLLFRVEGEPMALDVAIPNLTRISWEGLIALGSQVPSEMRGRF